MYNITDRIPQNPNQWTMQKSDGSSETVTLERADNPVNVGTPINRETLLGMQGFVGGTITFESSGNIVEANETGTMTTEFLSDGSIKQTFSGADGQTIIKTTTFGADGNITEVLG